MNPIPFIDLSRSHAEIRSEISVSIERCIDRSSFLRGPETQAFEEEWAAFSGAAHAVCCNSGTDALTLAARAMNLQTARVQSNTLPLTAIGLHLGGTKVQLVDCGPTGETTAEGPDSVPVLMYGRIPSKIDPSVRLYDAAHAHGWQPPESACAAFSFYPTKTLGALGDAGAITTNDADMAAHMRDLCGRDDRLRDVRQITSRIDEIQAAVLRVKLRKLPQWLAERAAIGAQYDARLASTGMTLPGHSLHHLYAIRVPRRRELMAFLEENGVQTKIHWADALHTMDGPWSALGAPFREAEGWCESTLSLPCFPGLREDEVDHVCDLILQFFEA
jgi:dTDP-4-amino-4,6-dideoxygalactose transaminase